MGGILQAVFHDLPIRCVPDKIPAKIEYEVSWMDLGDIARVKDIDTGEGVEIKLLPQQTVVSVVAPKALEEEIPAAEAEEAEGEEAAEGAAEGEEAPAPEGGEAG
jgi:large subunit ribosomal protein L25